VTVADHVCLRFTLTSDSEDLLVAELWALGTLGIEDVGVDSVSTNESVSRQILAYFEQPLTGEIERRLEGPAKWPGGRLESVQVVRATDWSAEYRRRTRPMEVGRGFLVDAGEPADRGATVPADRYLLRIPARTAFGTGSHESTQLAIELMEELSMEGSRVLDVGTGTGILAFAALLLGAKEVIGLDVDPAAVLVAVENCGLNRMKPRLAGGTVDCLRSEQRFDLVLVNVLPDRIRSYLRSIANLLPVGGQMIVSGLLVDQHSSYLRELLAFSLVEKRSSSSGEWIGCLMEKAI
jgi:ribosomal protein L11 methyltransferase